MEVLHSVMSPLPMLNEGEFDLLVRYSLEKDEGMVGAVMNAFLAADVNVYNRPTKLVEWIDADVFEQLQWTSGRPRYLCTDTWDHQVVMVAEEVRLYKSPAPDNGIYC